MGRGFGRGAKSVAVVTHAQVGRLKKTPRGLKFGKKKKAGRRKAEEEQAPIEEVDQQKLRREKRKEANEHKKSLSEKIAAVQFTPVVKGRKKGMRGLRKELIAATKQVRRQERDRKIKETKRQQTELARKHEMRRLTNAKQHHGVALEKIDATKQPAGSMPSSDDDDEDEDEEEAEE